MAVAPKAAHTIRLRILEGFLSDLHFCNPKCQELQSNITETTMYIKVPEQAARTLRKSYSEKKETNVRNMVDHRRLCHATARSELDNFYAVSRDVAAWHEKFQDLDGIYYFWMIRVASHYSNSSSQQGLATYASHFSIKLQFLTYAPCEATETRGWLHTPDRI